MTMRDRIQEAAGINPRQCRAILRELKNPSEEMISAMMHGFHLNKAPRQAMHDALVNGMAHILNEAREKPA